MRTGFSDKFLKSLNWALGNQEIIVVLIEIQHDDLSEPVRLCNQMADFTSNGNVYKARKIACSMPNEFSDETPTFTLTVDSPDHYLSLLCFPLDTQKTFTIALSLVIKSDPDAIQFLATFEAQEDAHDDTGSVFSGTLDFGLNEMFPLHSFTPESHPGAFGTID